MSPNDIVYVKNPSAYIDDNNRSTAAFRNRNGTEILPQYALAGPHLYSQPVYLLFRDLNDDDRAAYEKAAWTPPEAPDFDPELEKRVMAAKREQLTAEVGEEILAHHDDVFARMDAIFQSPDEKAIEDAAKDIYRSSNMKLNQCIETLRTADTYTYHHSMNLSLLFAQAMKDITSYSETLTIKREMTLDEDHIFLGVKASLVHDYGKIKLPPGLIDKPGKLTPEEFETVKKHPAIGAVALKKNGIDDAFVLGLVGNHHPAYLVFGEKQTYLQQVISMLDIFDACTAKRSYKEPFAVEKTLDILNENKENYRWHETLYKIVTQITIAKFTRNKRFAL